MKPSRPGASWVVFAAALGFLAGMLVMAAIVVMFPSGAASVTAPLNDAVTRVEVKPTKKDEPTPVSLPPATTASPPPEVVSYPHEDLRQRNLTLPVQGIKRQDLTDTFNDMRGTSRRHEALDVLAPRNTPVVAVEDGTVAKLFVSEAGGLTLYQFDPASQYAYYYAHLERYADGLKEGEPVKRGQVIGYVGTTGNAPRDTPHLHFAIFKLGEDKKWWQGTPVDPYSVLK